MDRVNQTAVREVTRKIQHSIASDWEYPLTPSLKRKRRSTGEHASSWRERYYGATDDEADPYSDEDAEKPIRDEKATFTYDTPDEVGSVEARKSESRRQRRDKRMKKELNENEGLRLYQRRRNAWTGAVTTKSYHARGHNAKSHDTPKTVNEESDASTGAEKLQELDIQDDSNTAKHEPYDQTDESEWEDGNTTGFEMCEDEDALVDVMVPVAEPIVPHDNIVRTQMISKSPSDLYDKIVRDTRSPVIPINLAHMTRIIVQGWKDEGNWPPIPAAPEPFIATRRRAQQGVAPSQKTVDAGHDPHGILANHRHLQKGVNSVKRVFRLSGDKFHPPPSAKALTSKQDI